MEGEGGSEPAADGNVDIDRGLGTNVHMVDAEGGAGAPGYRGDHVGGRVVALGGFDNLAVDERQGLDHEAEDRRELHDGNGHGVRVADAP